MCEPTWHAKVLDVIVPFFLPLKVQYYKGYNFLRCFKAYNNIVNDEIVYYRKSGILHSGQKII